MENEYEREIDLKLILSILATGLMSFTGVVVETAMNITFPTLMQQFQIGISVVQWITTGYLLVLAIVIPVSSFLKKRFKTKSLFLFANLVFIAGTVLCVVTPSFHLLLVGRLLQGIGTGIALPLMYNIVLEQSPLNKLGMMMGIASVITAIAPAVGPSLGGVIVNSFGWRMIFVVLLPLLILSFFVGLFSIRQVKPIEKVKFEWVEYIFLVLCFVSFIFATSLAGTVGWISIPVVGLLVLSAVTLIIFCRHSKKSDIPVINLKVFIYKPFSYCVVAFLLIQFICLGLGFLIPNYLQIVSGESALIAGCVLLPGCIVGAILTPVSGRLLDVLGAKKPIIIGNILIIVSTLCFSIFAENIMPLLFVIFYICFGAGQSFSAGNTMTNGLKQLPERLKSDGNAVFTTLQQLAGAIATSIVSTIVSTAQAKMPNNLAIATRSGSHNAFILLFLLSLVIICCSLMVFWYIQKKKA
jgi:DHA2 family lincomycin resistance protein-like MFS transporter